MHRSYGLQGSLKRRYKHPSLLPSMGTTRQKNSCRNRLQNGPHSLLRMKAGTHSPMPTGSHTAAYTPKHGRFGRGVVSLPSERFVRFGNPAWPGVRTAYFAAFGSWPGGALEERRKPTGQRCAHARRCPVGVAAPLGCVIFFASAEIAVCTSCAQGFLRVRDMGGITTLGVLRVLSKRWTAACQKGSFAVF